jgi:hypothetical protein
MGVFDGDPIGVLAGVGVGVGASAACTASALFETSPAAAKTTRTAAKINLFMLRTGLTGSQCSALRSIRLARERLDAANLWEV